MTVFRNGAAFDNKRGVGKIVLLHFVHVGDCYNDGASGVHP